MPFSPRNPLFMRFLGSFLSLSRATALLSYHLLSLLSTPFLKLFFLSTNCILLTSFSCFTYRFSHSFVYRGYILNQNSLCPSFAFRPKTDRKIRDTNPYKCKVQKANKQKRPYLYQLYNIQYVYRFQIHHSGVISPSRTVRPLLASIRISIA